MRCAVLLALAACGHGFFDPQTPCDGASVDVAPDSSMPVLYVQSNYTTSAGTSASNLDTTFPLPVEVGDTILVAIAFQSGGGTTFSSLVDSKNDTYTTAIGPTLSSGWQQFVFITSATSPATAGSEVVHAALSASAQMRVAIVAYRNVGAIDVAVAMIGGSSSPVESGSAVTRNTHDLLFAAGSSDGPISGAFPGYSTRILDVNTIIEDKEVFNAQSYQPMAGAGNNGNWVMQLVALRAL
jgi:hypothetical protein